MLPELFWKWLLGLIWIGGPIIVLIAAIFIVVREIRFERASRVAPPKSRA